MNIKERIKSIEKTDKGISIFHRATAEFLSSTAEIRPSVIFPGFYLDNEELYEEALHDAKDISDTVYNVNMLIGYMVKKFGVFGDENRRMDILLNGKADEDGMIGGVSITEFIGQDAALCCERSAFMHNCLRLLGYKDTIIFGKIKSEKANVFDNHAYNILVTGNANHCLIDATNHSKRANGNFIPTIFKLDLDTYTGLLTGSLTYKVNMIDHAFTGDKMEVDWEYF
ncbi:MAG: hypothetical protein Q4D02_05025 [Clostridia bacterium]|nr:hypothetical protein [Clostridia bacterium]